MRKSKFSIPASLTLALALSASAWASSDDELNHLKRENAEMKQMLMQMQKQLHELQMKTDAMEQQAREPVEDVDKKDGVVKSKKEDITISTTGGGIKVTSSKGSEFKIGAMLQLDHDSYDDFWQEDAERGDAEESKIRRSRIGLSGKNGKHWSYKFTVNIEHEGNKDWIDTGFIKYTTDPLYVRLGKYKRPGMIEARTSANWLATIERSIVNELSGAVLAKPQLGGLEVGFGTKGDMPMSGSIGIFDHDIEEGDDSDVYGIGGRFSIAPKLGEKSFFHAGASFYNVDYKGNTHHMRSRMGMNNISHRPFEAGVHSSDDVDQLGLELAYVNGPFSLQGEFMDMEFDGTNNSVCDSALPAAVTSSSDDTDACDLEMDGFYLQAAHTLTGEARGYKSGSGSFSGIKPKNKGGAWELVARYENADVEIPGRSLNADLERMVLGVNWYANRNVKMMLNYMESEIDGCAGGRDYMSDDPTVMGTYVFARCEDGDGDALSLRGQYTF